jgi:hypothetical protein
MVGQNIVLLVILRNTKTDDTYYPIKINLPAFQILKRQKYIYALKHTIHVNEYNRTVVQKQVQSKQKHQQKLPEGSEMTQSKVNSTNRLPLARKPEL